MRFRSRVPLPVAAGEASQSIERSSVVHFLLPEDLVEERRLLILSGNFVQLLQSLLATPLEQDCRWWNDRGVAERAIGDQQQALDSISRANGLCPENERIAANLRFALFVRSEAAPRYTVEEP
ncbi:MAG: hypothetical protein K1X75_07950 [Leptospirales bacterium]|nr:hypothetical protein [Leptospirales bacterium]